MQWLRLHRNSKAKSHGSCCWHAEEAFPLASLLLSTSFAEATQAARLWGCPWLLANTCILSPGQEVTNCKKLAKAAPRRANIFLTMSSHSQESSGVTAQCICSSSSHQQPSRSACPMLLLWQLYWLIYFALLLTLSVVMSKAMDAGGWDSSQSHLFYVQNLQSFQGKFLCNFFHSKLTSNLPLGEFNILCSQHATEWLRRLLSLLESRRITFYFVVCSCSNGNKCCGSGLDHLHEKHIVPMEATQVLNKDRRIQVPNW